MKKIKFGTFLLFIILLSNMKTVSASAQEKKFEFFIEGKQGSFQPAQSSYLGTQIGASPNIFNFVTVGDDLNKKAQSIGFNYQLHQNSFFKYFSGLQIKSHIETGSADQKERFDTLDPMGNNLLIPGVGVGPSGTGFFLPGPNNQIIDAQYNTEFDYHTFLLGVETKARILDSKFTLKPSFSVEYSRATTDNSFSGNIPFFIRQFDYNTKTTVETISPTVGLDLSYRINPTFDIFSGAQYAYNFNRGKGRDTLNFTGFGDQTASTSNNQGTHSYKVKTGVNINLNMPFILTIEGSYQRLGNVPVVDIRDGINVSDFSYEDADVYNGAIRARFKF